MFDPTDAPLLEIKRTDATTQIAKRAYELYEQHGHLDGQADQDWLQAEQEIRKINLVNNWREPRLCGTTYRACHR